MENNVFTQLMNTLADEQDQTESWTPEKKATRTEQTTEEKGSLARGVNRHQTMYFPETV